MSLERQNTLQNIRNAVLHSGSSMISTVGFWAAKKLPSVISGIIDPEIAHLRGNPIAGSIGLVTRAHELLPEMKKLTDKDSSGICTCWLGTSPTYLITRPEDIKKLMLLEKKHMKKPATAVFEEILDKNNFFITEINKIWDRQRKIYDHNLYAPRNFQKLDEEIKRVIDEHAVKLKKEDELELNKFCSDVTMDVLAQTLLGIDSLGRELKESSKTKLDLMHETVDGISQVLFNVCENLKFQLAKFFRCRTPKATRDASALLRKNFTTLLQTDAKQIESHHSLLKAIAEEEGNSSATLADKLKMDFVLGHAALIFLAGHEAASNLINFILRELIVHRDKHKQFNYDDIVKEALRLYPPVPLYARAVTNDFEFTLQSGKILFFKKGATILISPWITHRLNHIFENPEKFIPERWQQFSGEPDAFIPFGAGVRKCPARKVAFTLTRSSIFEFLKYIDLNSVTEKEQKGILETTIKGSLQPVNPVHLKVLR